MMEKLRNAEPWVLEAWMLSTAVVALALGTYFADYLKQYALWVLVIGVIVRLYITYVIYK